MASTPGFVCNGGRDEAHRGSRNSRWNGSGRLDHLGRHRWFIPFAVVSVMLIAALPRVATWFFARYGNRVIEPEIKLVFASLFLLTWLGSRASSQAALPAFVLGLVMSSSYV